MASIETDVRFVKGIGEKRAKLLNKISIFTLRDFLTYFPRDYEDRTRFQRVAELVPGETACVKAVIATEITFSGKRGGLTYAKFTVFDESGSLNITFFNNPYIKSKLHKGGEYIFFGKAQKDLSRVSLINPVFEPAEDAGKETGKILPVYPLISGLSRKLIMQGAEAALIAAGDNPIDVLPQSLRERYALAHVRYAYENIHFPKTVEDALLSRRRFVFEELLFLSLGLKHMKSKRKKEDGIPLASAEVGEFLLSFGFTLTNAQKNAIRDAVSDMSYGRLMNRLIQGDVGSGKTAVAAACVYLAAKNGYQSALMAPTSILAEQHFLSLTPLFEKFSMKVGLLTGGMSGKEKADVYEKSKTRRN